MENLDRTAKMQDFIRKHSAADFEIRPLTADASSRKYYRAFFAGGATAVVMDDEGCRCRTREFVELSDFLRRRGVYVPAVTAKDFDNGFLLLEDLGDLTVTKALTADNEMKLYQKAGEAIAKIAAIRERPQCAGELSRRRIIDDVRLFTQWYFPMAAGFPLPDDAEKEFLEIFERLSEMAFRVPQRLVLWDYHIDNIMLPPGHADCAVIDFQDAMWGPLTYDIVSLLAADRRTASPQVIAAVKDSFFAALENVSRQDFEDSYAFLSMYRHLRVLGRFTTLSMVNQKERYLQYIPQTWQMLERALAYPKLAEMRRWLERWMPQELRRLPARKPIRQAMMMAAGRGTRMQNLTDDCPKPLIKVGNRALIDYNFDRLKEVNIRNIVVNLCYKGEMIREHLLSAHPDFEIRFSEEAEALETGGGVKKALPLLSDPAFFVINSDVFYIDRGYKPALWRMIDAWDENKYDILLLLQKLEDVCGDRGIGDYRIDRNGLPERNAAKTTGFPYMFGGVSIVSRKIFDGIENEKFSLRDLFDVAQNRGKLGFVVNEAEFFHVGTPAALEAAEIKIHRHK